MSVIGSNVLAGASGGGAAGYEIERSLRFNSADSAYLNRTPTSNGSQTTATWSFWVKRAALGVETTLFGHGANSANDGMIQFNGADRLQVYWRKNSAAQINYQTDQVFRDASAWYHIVVRIDTTVATTVKIWINGAEVSDWAATPTNATVDDTLILNNTSYANYIGKWRGDTNPDTNAYLADVHFIDGQALAATDFGEYDDNNVWQPKEYSGTYGPSVDQSQTWSNSLTTSGTFSVAATTAFDGVPTQYCRSTGAITFTPASAITFTDKVEVYTAFQGTTTVNGSTGPALPNSAGFVTLASGGGSLTGFVLTNSSTDAFLGAVRVDGELLVDSGVTPATNGFHLDFSDNSSAAALGYDAAGSNDWTVNNLSVASGAGNDSLIDTPTNYEASGNNGGNYCTWNPLQNASLANGNLDTAGTGNFYGTFALPSSGKWYWEVTAASTSYIGIDTRGQGGTNYIHYNPDGQKQTASGTSSYGASFTTGDIIGVAVNMDNEQITWYKNGASQGVVNFSTASLSNTDTIQPQIYQDSSATSSTNWGARPFTYTPPTGYKSLCTQNLADPTIADGSTAFDGDLWSGDNTDPRTRTLSFGPDLVWIKTRNQTNWHSITDSVRGAPNKLYTNSTNAEDTAPIYGQIDSFNSDGFTLGGGTDSSNPLSDSNQTGTNYVAWAWDAGANSSKTYTVTVVSDSGNKYRFDGHGTSAVTLDLEEGSTYVFDQSDSSNATHPLRFATAADAAGGTEYTTGVTVTGTPGQAGAKTTITVASGAPTLYYYCSSHSGMGGQANTNSTAGASNFDGSIQSTVRANASAGFSIVAYAGNSTNNSTIGHGLNAAPELIITKNRDGAYNWITYSAELAATKVLALDATNAPFTPSGGYYSNVGSSTYQVVQGSANLTNLNNSGDDYIAYCFAPVEGYSAFGSYTGNGNDDGPFVYTGFRPKWVLLKSSTVTGSWVIYDASRNTYNVANSGLYPNYSNAEGSGANNKIDILSNGFKVRGAGGSDPATNTNNETIIYACFAAHPFKTARAR